jgi:heme oxygenase (biliverdin-IX-beta and delta-forming)
MSALLHNLRQATNERHQALHDHPLLIPLQSSLVTIEDYFWCVQGMYAFYSRMESMPPVPCEEYSAPMLAWLKKDIKFHAIIPIEIDIPDIIMPRCPSSYLGYLYVKNGSTLGGRVISKHLSKYLGLIEHRSNHFFAGYGKETGMKWKKFVAALEESEVDSEKCALQAIDSFSAMKLVFDHIYEHKMARLHQS